MSDKSVAQRLSSGPDVVPLVAGLIVLATATSTLTGGFGHVQWTLTGTAVGIGAILLLSSLWDRR